MCSGDAHRSSVGVKKAEMATIPHLRLQSLHGDEMLTFNVSYTRPSSCDPTGVHPGMPFTPVSRKKDGGDIIPYIRLVFSQTPYDSKEQTSLAFNESPRGQRDIKRDVWH
jgi:hypothetical protein